MTYFSNRLGQMDFPLIGFAVLTLSLLFLAPVGIKIFSAINTNVGGQLTNQSSVAGTNFTAVMTPLITWWDKIIIFAFVIAIILLFISAFMIDTHPVWVILYIIVGMFTIIFSNAIQSSLQTFYETTTFLTAAELALLPYVTWVYTNFGYFLVGIMILTGVIMYGKIAYFSRGAMR